MSIHSLAFNGAIPFATLLVTGGAELVGEATIYGVAALLTAAGAIFIYRRYARQAFVALPQPHTPTTPASPGKAL